MAAATRKLLVRYEMESLAVTLWALAVPRLSSKVAVRSLTTRLLDPHHGHLNGFSGVENSCRHSSHLACHLFSSFIFTPPSRASALRVRTPRGKSTYQKLPPTLLALAFPCRHFMNHANLIPQSESGVNHKVTENKNVRTKKFMPSRARARELRHPLDNSATIDYAISFIPLMLCCVRQGSRLQMPVLCYLDAAYHERLNY